MTAKEKERMAIQMIKGNQTSRDICKKCHISPNQLTAIKKKLSGVSRPQVIPIQAYNLFNTGHDPFHVVTMLGIAAAESRKYFYDYLMLKGLKTMLNLCITLGPHTVTQLNLLHKALARNGVNPNFRSHLRQECHQN